MSDDNDEFPWDYSYFKWQDTPREVRRQMVLDASQFGRTWMHGRTWVVADIFKCDILGVTVVSSKNHETKAMGAAYLAGSGRGLFQINRGDQLATEAGRDFHSTHESRSA